MTSIALAPGLHFAQVFAALRAEGWRNVGESQTPPIIEGEPELVFFGTEEHDDEVTYSFNPVFGLRTLDASGPGGRALLARLRLPRLRTSEIRSLLREDDPARSRFGLYAADKLKLWQLVPDIQALALRGSGSLAEAATNVHRRLVEKGLEQGLRALALRQEAAPDRSLTFEALDRFDRRQVVRWLIADELGGAPSTTKILRSALADSDWEVRLSGMLAATRLGQTALAPIIERLAGPEDRVGFDPVERSKLRTLRAACTALLAGVQPWPEPDTDSVPHDQASALAHASRCAAGVATIHDRLFLLAVALSTPVRVTITPPSTLPAGLELDGAVAVHRSGRRFRWIGTGSAWLGLAGPDESTVRRFEHTRGAFVSERVEQDGAKPWLGNHAEARLRLGQLNQELGLDLFLPDPDLLELATRGDDGRRFPWGNGLEGKAEGWQSPYGVIGTFRGPAEWSAQRREGVALAIGGHRWNACGWRQWLGPDARAALRPMLVV